MSEHAFTLDLSWTGRTEDPRSFDRSFVLSGQGKENIAGSAEPLSLGDPNKWNPEELLLASLASCHMLWYLYLCSAAKIVVTQYSDQPSGALKKGKLAAFAEATLNPQVILTDPSRIEEATALHKQAHEKCLIANSINFEVKVMPQVTARS